MYVGCGLPWHTFLFETAGWRNLLTSSVLVQEIEQNCWAMGWRMTRTSNICLRDWTWDERLAVEYATTLKLKVSDFLRTHVCFTPSSESKTLSLARSLLLVMLLVMQLVMLLLGTSTADVFCQLFIAVFSMVSGSLLQDSHSSIDRAILPRLLQQLSRTSPTLTFHNLAMAKLCTVSDNFLRWRSPLLACCWRQKILIIRHPLQIILDPTVTEKSDKQWCCIMGVFRLRIIVNNVTCRPMWVAKWWQWAHRGCTICTC